MGLCSVLSTFLFVVHIPRVSGIPSGDYRYKGLSSGRPGGESAGSVGLRFKFKVWPRGRFLLLVGIDLFYGEGEGFPHEHKEGI